MADKLRQTYSFKSVGSEPEDKTNPTPDNDIPIGIKTPLELERSRTGLYKMHTELIDQIADNFRNMISTNHGERIGLFDFGGNLEELSFELSSNENMIDEALRRIKSTTKKYMPFIDLEDFVPLVKHSDNQALAKVGVRISFGVPSLDVTNQIIEVVIFTAG